MESKYFENSWKGKLQQLRRHVRSLLRGTVKRYRKRKAYTRFLTEEEQRWLVIAKSELSNRVGMPYDPRYAFCAATSGDPSSGQVLFLVEEESNFCLRCCCGKSRPFVMKISNSNMREVITLCRPYRSTSCLCPCFLQEMEVFVNALKIGTIKQDWNPLRPSYSICNLHGDTIIKIKGPACSCPFMSVNFKIFSSDGKHEIGRVSKKWSGLVQEFFTNADVFGISFPMDLDVQTKALLLASCLLIDFMYFEGSGKNICL